MATPPLNTTYLWQRSMTMLFNCGSSRARVIHPPWWLTMAPWVANTIGINIPMFGRKNGYFVSRQDLWLIRARATAPCCRRRIWKQPHPNIENNIKTVGCRGEGKCSHGQLQGLGYHWEIWMMKQGGMTNHDVLKTATINPAPNTWARWLDRFVASWEVGWFAGVG